MFQFLIGSLVTGLLINYYLLVYLFQFLIGSLVTHRYPVNLLRFPREFQFLIGSLVTENHVLALALHEGRFNSS